MRQLLNANFRQAKPVDMAILLDEIESNMLVSMQANVGLKLNLEMETFEDYRVCKAKFEILYRIGLLDPEEYQRMSNKAFQIRLEFLAAHGVEANEHERD